MLPLSIRHASNISGFKKGVRDYLFQEMFNLIKLF